MKPAIVTGGASPLGAAMCRELAGQGLHVIVHARAGILIGAVRALSLEVASRGITVNAVAPGIIESPAAAAAFDRKRIAQIVPMKRAGTPAEIAALVGFLVSGRAAYISGQTISINGGMAAT